MPSPRLLRARSKHANDTATCRESDDSRTQPSAYVAIQQARFDERLTIERRIASDTLNALVPALILQPLVENAIKHGLEKRRGALNIVISADRKADTLTLRIADDGPGVSGSKAPNQGIGLRNTCARLQETYGSRQSFALRPNLPSGTVAEVLLPWKPATQMPALTESRPIRP